jgi:Wnt and FGF inhibitory regulator
MVKRSSVYRYTLQFQSEWESVGLLNSIQNSKSISFSSKCFSFVSRTRIFTQLFIAQCPQMAIRVRVWRRMTHHDVITGDGSSQQYCQGYLDGNDQWNTGFFCPPSGGARVVCCGNETYKYCCATMTTTTAPSAIPTHQTQLTTPDIIR